MGKLLKSSGMFHFGHQIFKNKLIIGQTCWSYLCAMVVGLVERSQMSIEHLA
jgi:hypothetical protein